MIEITGDERLRELIDERLFAAFWDAANHFKTADLVLYFDTLAEGNPIQAFVRETMLENDPPEALKSKIRKPAKDAAQILRQTEVAFWLVVSFPEDMVIASVVASRIKGGGSA